MQSTDDTPPSDAAAFAQHNTSADRADVGVLLQSVVDTTSAILALARAEARLAYRSALHAALWAAAVFLLALTAWWLLCTIAVVGAHAFGLSWFWSLCLLLLVHAAAIFFSARYVHALFTGTGFPQTRAQLDAIKNALNPEPPST
ncbi:hypothetical protein ELE36_08830 [Pseudolysobacter antarcticus]|uniref:Phage holin family protein n=1 Tax=Pseudolysobacter antarcticus TaxID=2511995 RepID=A0A411HJ04_9GAMM|nr:hypothetical protein [Pseudolysobacter antarcticus]QBB70461.1 hypothetical protein ELE36_08830 [Pseudolysobacter antarcticus]